MTTTASPTTARDVSTRDITTGRLGDSPTRPDGVAKVQGTFSFSGDLSADGFLWGATLRSPHPYARIVRIDVSPAWKINGVEAVVTADPPQPEVCSGAQVHIVKDAKTGKLRKAKATDPPVASVTAPTPP